MNFFKKYYSFNYVYNLKMLNASIVFDEISIKEPAAGRRLAIAGNLQPVHVLNLKIAKNRIDIDKSLNGKVLRNHIIGLERLRPR